MAYIGPDFVGGNIDQIQAEHPFAPAMAPPEPSPPTSPPFAADAGHPTSPTSPPFAAGAGPQSPPSGPRLVVHIDNGVESVAPMTFGDERLQDDLLARCRAAAGPVILQIHDLGGWEDARRWHLYNWVLKLIPNCAIRRDDDATIYTDPFEAAVAGLVGVADVARHDRCLHAALEAAAVFHPGNIDAACNRIMDQLRQLGVRGKRLDRLTKDVRALAKQAPATADGAMTPIIERFPGAPVSANAIMPLCWRVENGHIGRIQKNGDVQFFSSVLTEPIFIKSRLRDVHAGLELVELAHRRIDGWQVITVGRTVIADRSKIITLAGRGLPIDSNNANGVIQFLADYLETNGREIGCRPVTHQCGWHNNFTRFVLGDTVVVPAVAGSCQADGFPGSNSTEIVFRGADDGDDQLAGVYRSAGSLENWRSAIAELAGYPKAILLLLASLSTPLLRLFNVPNYFIETCGPTSTGKTTAIMVAGSAWGRPSLRTRDSVIDSYDNTRTWNSRAMEVRNDLPNFVDDTKTARRKEQVVQMIYDIASGRGRGRGSREGTRVTDHFSTASISSGETPATSFTQDAGARARAIILWGSPFGRADAANGTVVRRIMSAIEGNFGHAGPAFVQYLLNYQEKWNSWLQRFQQLQGQYVRLAGDNSVVGRQAQHFALLAVTAEIACHAGVLTWVPFDPIAPLWNELIGEAETADTATEALRLAIGWAQSNAAKFIGQLSNPDHPPHSGYAGRWDKDESWEYLAFFPQTLKEVLQREGHDYGAVVRAWRDLGLIRTIPSRRDGLVQVRLHRAEWRNSGSDRAWVVAITRKAFDELVGSVSPDTGMPTSTAATPSVNGSPAHGARISTPPSSV